MPRSRRRRTLGVLWTLSIAAAYCFPLLLTTTRYIQQDHCYRPSYYERGGGGGFVVVAASFSWQPSKSALLSNPNPNPNHPHHHPHPHHNKDDDAVVVVYCSSSRSSRLRMQNNPNPVDSNPPNNNHHDLDGRLTATGTYRARFLEDNGLEITTDSEGHVSARPSYASWPFVSSSSPQQHQDKDKETTTAAEAAAAAAAAAAARSNEFNVILTHATADFDSLASAVGLAKLWESAHYQEDDETEEQKDAPNNNNNNNITTTTTTPFDSASPVPTYVVLPRGAHPNVQRFLSLHQHLFPIRSLKSFQMSDWNRLNRLALVDAQRKDRIASAVHLLDYAKRITVVDHHVDQASDIDRIDDYVVDSVGSVTTLIVERIQLRAAAAQQQQQQLRKSTTSISLTEAEATLLALGIHADTGHLCFESTTPRDVQALAYCMEHGKASQAAIAAHAAAHGSSSSRSSAAAAAAAAAPPLSREQQHVLNQALLFTNTTVVHGGEVTIASVLLRVDGFINGLAAVTHDAMELSRADVYFLAVVYETTPSGKSRKKKRQKRNNNQQASSSSLLSLSQHADRESKLQHSLGAKLVEDEGFSLKSRSRSSSSSRSNREDGGYDSATPLDRRIDDDAAIPDTMASTTLSWTTMTTRDERLRAAFDRYDRDLGGTLDAQEVAAALSQSGSGGGHGVIASTAALADLMQGMDRDGNGSIDFEEFVALAEKINRMNHHHNNNNSSNNSLGITVVNGMNHDDDDETDTLSPELNASSFTMIVIGRARAGMNVQSVKLHKLLEPLGGGGHAKAASATIRLRNASEARTTLQHVVNDLISSSSSSSLSSLSNSSSSSSRRRYQHLPKPPTVGDFMTAPVLSARPHMTEQQVEDLFVRYDVRALPVVDDSYQVIGLVTYKEVAAAKQRLWNKEQKRLTREREAMEERHGRGGEAVLQPVDSSVHERGRRQQHGSNVKAWMKQHVHLVEASTTMAQVESMMLDNDVGCMPVVADGTKQLVGMVTRTDVLRQHRYYPSLHYHNKGFADSIAARKPMIELRKKLKKFDLEE